jgi:uncharacterized protein (DUF1697 family)
MPVLACLLRAVNVGGRNAVGMAALTEVCGAVGLEDARTLLQSGNVVFRSGRQGRTQLAAKLKDAIVRKFEVQSQVLLRSREELQAALDANPFAAAALKDPSHLLILFFDGKPANGAAQALAAWDRGPEKARLVGPNLYLHYGEGMGRSKLTNAWIEKTLGASGTARNWNTVTKLAGICAALEDGA